MLMRDKLLFEILRFNERRKKDIVYWNDMKNMIDHYAWNPEMLYLLAKHLKNIDIPYIQKLLIQSKSPKYLYLFASGGYKGLDYNLITKVICDSKDVKYMFKMAKHIKSSNKELIVQTLIKMNKKNILKHLIVDYPITRKTRIINNMINNYIGQTPLNDTILQQKDNQKSLKFNL